MTAKLLCIWNSSNSGVWKQSKGLGDVRATEGLRICVVWRRWRETPLSIQFLAIGLGGQMFSGTMMSNSINISGFLLCGRPLSPSPKSLCISYQIKTALCACCVEESIENELHTWLWKVGAEEGSAVCSVTAQASHSSRAQVKKWPSEHKLSNLKKRWGLGRLPTGHGSLAKIIPGNSLIPQLLQAPLIYTIVTAL